MRSLTQFILEANTKKWFPKNVKKLWDSASKASNPISNGDKLIKTGKELVDYLYDDLYNKVDEIQKNDVEKIFKGFEDKKFIVVYSNGNYGGQDEVYELEEKIFGGEECSVLKYEDDADVNLSKETKDSGYCTLLRFASDNESLFCCLDDGDYGNAYYCLTV
jgi:hypothetical protein